MNQWTVFMVGTMINHHRAFMHMIYTLALCQNRVFIPTFRLHFCLLSSVQFEFLIFSKMATGQSFDFLGLQLGNYRRLQETDCRIQLAGVCLQESDCRSWIARVRLQESDCRSHIFGESDCWIRIAGVRFLEMDFRSEISSEISPTVISLRSFFCLVFN